MRTIPLLLRGLQREARSKGKSLPGFAVACCLSFAFSTPARSQAIDQWAWMGGCPLTHAAVTQQSGWSGLCGVYGTLGTPAAGNNPGSRLGAMSWTDSSGRLWLFGGFGFDAINNSGYLNDVWEFNPSTNQWAWMGGSSTVDSTGGRFGVYGTKGQAAAGNIPGSRQDAANWTDSSGHLWLFGGYGHDADDHVGYLNDLWEFNPSAHQWTYMGGSELIDSRGGAFGVYGTLGTPAAGNIPGARWSAASWTDSSGHLWLFGGNGHDADDNTGNLNDLWEFFPSLNEWAYMGGNELIDSRGGAFGVYGTLGTPAAGNIPGSRSAASSWTDHSGNFWLFGGMGQDADDNGGYLNDLWEFNPLTKEWAYRGGSELVSSNGPSGMYAASIGTPSAADIPGGRWGAVSWTDASGHLWLLGGNGFDANGSYGYLNDLWEFSPAANEWAWMGGCPIVNDSINNQSSGWYGACGVYGLLGTASAGNNPGGRYGAPGWSDGSGHLWLLGGYGYDANGNLGYLNDLWRYQPFTTSTPPTATPFFNVAAQTVTIMDATAGATIYYTTNGNTPTASSARYTGPITVSSTETIEAIAVASGQSTSSVASVTVTVSKPAFACHIGYSITSQWSGGFGAAITINNTGTSAIANWSLTWTFANGQKITQVWNGNGTQSGANVTVTNLSYNGSIPAGGSYSGMGFNGSWNNTKNAVPTSFAVNGTTCK